MVNAHQLRISWTIPSFAPSSSTFSPPKWLRAPGNTPGTQKRWRIALTSLAIAALTIWGVVPQLIACSVRADCHNSLTAVPDAPVALVLGAGITARGQLTPVLRDRVNAAIALYRAGKVRLLLMTGDNAHVTHNEPWAMRRYAIGQGVPASAIYCDFAGFHTYDSCYRARRIFGVDHAVVVTQSFHLARAVFLARELGIDASGYAAHDPLSAAADLHMKLRENTSALVSLLDLAIHKRPHFLGQPISLAKT